MSKFLVLNHHHFLTPIAHRLRQEGHDVILAPFRRRYEKAWQGVLDEHIFSVRTKDRPKVAEFAMEQETVVLTDSFVWLQELEQAQVDLEGRLWASLKPTAEDVNMGGIRLGAWWDGTSLTAPHILVSDWGAWPAGLGPNKEGGLTLVAPLQLPAQFEEVLHAIQGQLPPEFRGLVQGTVQVWPGDEIKLVRVEGGWVPLHMHAFLLAMGEESISKVLLGDAEPRLTHRYSLVAPLTVPPWPAEGNAESKVIRGLTSDQMGEFFWHDVMLRDGELWVAGLDGFVGVAKGWGQTVEDAQAKLHQNLWSVDVDEKQFRSDAGGSVRAVLGRLADYGFFL